MIDWGHVGEIVASNFFVAGVAYGAIKADLKGIHERVRRCEDDIRKLIFRGE